MSNPEDKLKHQVRRRSHIIYDLHKPKYHQQIRDGKQEEDGERRYRKYKDIKEIGLDEIEV